MPSILLSIIQILLNTRERPVGVVTYPSAKDAEVIQKQTHGKQIGGHKIRVTFCAPGYSANEVCMRVASVSIAYTPTCIYINIELLICSLTSFLSLPLYHFPEC